MTHIIVVIYSTPLFLSTKINFQLYTGICLPNVVIFLFFSFFFISFSFFFFIEKPPNVKDRYLKKMLSKRSNTLFQVPKTANFEFKVHYHGIMKNAPSCQPLTFHTIIRLIISHILQLFGLLLH